MTPPKPKKDAVRSARFAKGGTDHMVRQQAAGPAAPARTGKVPTAAPGKRAAAGGGKTRGFVPATPAVAGRTAPLPKRGR